MVSPWYELKVIYGHEDRRQTAGLTLTQTIRRHKQGTGAADARLVAVQH
jgi:hypothetical protein